MVVSFCSPSLPDEQWHAVVVEHEWIWNKFWKVEMYYQTRIAHNRSIPSLIVVRSTVPRYSAFKNPWAVTGNILLNALSSSSHFMNDFVFREQNELIKVVTDALWGNGGSGYGHLKWKPCCHYNCFYVINVFSCRFCRAAFPLSWGIPNILYAGVRDGAGTEHVM